MSRFFPIKLHGPACTAGLAACLLLALTIVPAMTASTDSQSLDQFAIPQLGYSVPGFIAPQPNEHPRLLFRQNDLPALRARAETSEGQAILRRLRETLNGSDGRTMPSVFNPVVGPPPHERFTPFDGPAPLGTYTFSHIVGYGLLYQLTGDPLYADLGRQSFELALEGYRDRDTRYSFRHPSGALRAGPVVGWTAVGFDLCYDGWDEATRQRLTQALVDYREPLSQHEVTLPLLTTATMPPHSNHYSMQVGGAALALLAIHDKSGRQFLAYQNLLAHLPLSLWRNLNEGFGDGGYFAEGDGTGSMASQIVFLTALAGWRNAAGMDVYSSAPNAAMTVLKYLYQTIPRNGVMEMWPIRGGYPHNVWSREGLSGGGYFSIGFGVLSEEEQAALLWFYNHALRDHDEANGMPFDTVSPYPHHAVSAFVNWPFALQPRNPAEVLPRSYRDRRWGFFAFRNRWQDENDIVVTALTQPARGYMGAPADPGLMVHGLGQKFPWGEGLQPVRSWLRTQDGSAVLQLVDGRSLAIDFSGLSGAEALLITTGLAEGETFLLEETPVTVKILTTGQAPLVESNGQQLIIGSQVIVLHKGSLQLMHGMSPFVEEHF